MFPAGSRPVRPLVVGDEAVEEALSGWRGDAGRTLAVDTADPDALRDGGVGERRADCLVLDGRALGATSVDIVERCVAERPEVPVVLLVDEGDEQVAVEALSAGATETLPRAVVDRPGVFVERLVSTVERERGRPDDRFELVTRHLDEAIFIARGPHPPPDDGADADPDVDTDIREVDADAALARWDFEYLTPAVEHVLDRPLGDVYDDSTLLMELLVPEDRPEYDAWLREVSAELARGDHRESYSVEYRVRDSGGSVRWMRTNAYPVPLDEGYRLVGITEDITDRRERQHRLETERDRRSVLFENSPDPIMAVTFVDERPHITEVNAAFEDVFGFDADTVGDRPLVEVLIPEDEREQFDRFRQQVLRGEPVEGEARRRTADGERTFLIRTLPFETDGERHAYVWYTDVTERRRRERMVETLHDATERLQDAETTDAVCRTAVRAARDTLDLPMTACWLHRETDDGPALELVAATDPVRDIDPPPFRPGDVEYETYRDCETLVYDPSDYFPENPLEAAIMLPLGEHGLLAVGKAGVASYDEFVVDAARTLAGHVRTALDRVARAEQLRESERRLGAILDRIDEAIFLAPATEINDSDPAPEYVSSGYEDIYGQSLESMHETHEEGFFGTLHPDDYDDYWAFVDGIHRDVVDGDAKDRYSREYRIERPDGDVRWIHSDYYPTEWDDACKIVIVSRDITERKERERTLESFHDATAELTTAETVEEAARVAVRAAADVFGLPATAVYGYDDETGVLEPAARGPDVDDDLPALTAEDDVAWTTFVEETMRRVALEDLPALDVGPSEEALLVPLGGNGILVVWQTAETLDPDAASIIAATVEAALNRLRGERQLQSRSRELEAQVERARRLEAITELTRRIEAAITDESTRRGIQEAVCEELTDVDPFGAAWVAEADVGADRLTPRTAAGIDRDHAEATLDGGDRDGDPHPAHQAWRTGEPSVVNDLVGGRRSGWRRALLGRGGGSVCAVPLAYSGVTHGVLTIVADEPDAFGDREVDVLDQLGTSIGYAMTAIERQRALESDDTLELEFRGTGADVPFARLARETGCRVRHERTVRRQDGSVSVYYTLSGDPPDDPGAAADGVLPGRVETVTREAGEAVVERRGSSWFGSVVTEYGGVLRRGRATPSDATLVVELPQEADTRTIVDRVQDAFPELELTAQRQHRETVTTPQEVGDRLERRLSDRQYEALETAHAMGYFDWPRENSGEDVAEALDITQPTVNKHIRLGERKVFDLLFGADSPVS